MKKLFFLISAALLSFNMFAGEQGDDNGFEIKLFAGFSSDKYGTLQSTDDQHGNKVKYDAPEQPGLHKTPELGFTLGNRWYLANPGKFGIGIHARWLDFAYAHKDWNTDEYKKGVYGVVEEKDYIKIGVGGPGVIGTFYINDKMAIDAYYNIVPTMVNAITNYTYNSDYLTYMGSDFVEKECYNRIYYKFSHYFGTAFRYKKFQAGLEYNIAKTEYLIGERDEYNSPMIAKYNMNNFRLFLGLKF